MLDALFVAPEIPPDLQQDHTLAALRSSSQRESGVVALPGAVIPLLYPPRVGRPAKVPAVARFAGGGVVVRAQGDELVVGIGLCQPLRGHDVHTLVALIAVTPSVEVVYSGYRGTGALTQKRRPVSPLFPLRVTGALLLPVGRYLHRECPRIVLDQVVGHRRVQPFANPSRNNSYPRERHHPHEPRHYDDPTAHAPTLPRLVPIFNRWVAAEG